MDSVQHAVTWAGLLGQWVELAKSALALPQDEAGQRLRAAVADIIMLQAVAHALKQVKDLPAAERALGLDRAGLLIDKHEAALRARFGHQMPQQLNALVAEARAELKRQEDRKRLAPPGS